MGKKPAVLSLKHPVSKKRLHDDGSDFSKRKQQYEKLKELRQELKERKAKIGEKLRKERERLEEKKRRKEINTMKSGGYEIIQNPQKIKKWKKKARNMIQRLPPELFYEKFKK